MEGVGGHITRVHTWIGLAFSRVDRLSQATVASPALAPPPPPPPHPYPPPPPPQPPGARGGVGAPRIERSAEARARDMELAANEALEESAALAGQGNLAGALDKAKEAVKRERALVRFLEVRGDGCVQCLDRVVSLQFLGAVWRLINRNAPTAPPSPLIPLPRSHRKSPPPHPTPLPPQEKGLAEAMQNTDLTFAVQFHLGDCLHRNGLLGEALSVYTQMLREGKAFQHPARVRINMGNVHFEQQEYAKAIKARWERGGS